MLPRGHPDNDVESAELSDPTLSSTARVRPCPGPEPDSDVLDSASHEGLADPLRHPIGACPDARTPPVGPEHAQSGGPSWPGGFPEQSPATEQEGRIGGIGTGHPHFPHDGPSPTIPGSGRGLSTSNIVRLAGLVVIASLGAVTYHTFDLKILISSSFLWTSALETLHLFCARAHMLLSAHPGLHSQVLGPRWVALLRGGVAGAVRTGVIGIYTTLSIISMICAVTLFQALWQPVHSDSTMLPSILSVLVSAMSVNVVTITLGQFGPSMLRMFMPPLLVGSACACTLFRTAQPLSASGP